MTKPWLVKVGALFVKKRMRRFDTPPWNSSYPLIRRKLAVTQQETIQNAISKLKTCSYFDANIAKDNVKYTLYVNYHKVASGYKAFIENFPNDIQTVIKEMLLLASPLYYKNHKS